MLENSQFQIALFRRRTKLKKMFVLLFLFFLPHLGQSSEIICQVQTFYEQICYTYDYTKPECGPYLMTCPIDGVSYDTICSTYVCKVKLFSIENNLFAI